MENARIPTSEQLMAEMAWVRQLARALVKDATIADDVAQDAWLVANEKQPDADRPLRPWLARVVKNLIRTRRRGEARREQRDEAYEDRTVATPEQLVQRVELQRAVADEVLALAEPYRSTVLLHFVEGLSSADIARQERIPDGTVRRRLKVALDQLREALEKRANPPKRGWLAALIPLARLPGSAPAAVATSAGVLLVKKVVAAVILLLVLLGAAFLWRRKSEHSSGPQSAGSDSPPARGTGHAKAELPPWFATTAARRRIAGHVITSAGPAGGARVTLGIAVASEPHGALVFEDATPLLQTIAETTAGPDGAFDFGEQPGARFTISASAAEHAGSSTVVDTSNPRVDAEHIVVRLGGCEARVAGTVSDASGGRIAHARVQTNGSSVESDASGAYSVCISAQHAWGTPSAKIRVSAESYGTVVYTLLVATQLRLDIQLVPEATLVGHVTLADGTPVPQAQVVAMADPTEMPHHLASGWAVTDRDGAFRIAALAPGAFGLQATANGMRTYELVPAFAQSTTTSREIHLVLESHARVRGRVVSHGAPVGGAVVMSIHDGMVTSTISQADGSFEAENVKPGKTRFDVGAYQLT
ncbi:MAG TPA: sigma-70 family RNA polymerase sigma factor, partial [Kofleriaceae bacterium]